MSLWCFIFFCLCSMEGLQLCLLCNTIFVNSSSVLSCCVICFKQTPAVQSEVIMFFLWPHDKWSPSCHQLSALRRKIFMEIWRNLNHRCSASSPNTPERAAWFSTPTQVTPSVPCSPARPDPARLGPPDVQRTWAPAGLILNLIPTAGHNIQCLYKTTRLRNTSSFSWNSTC